MNSWYINNELDGKPFPEHLNGARDVLNKNALHDWLRWAQLWTKRKPTNEEG